MSATYEVIATTGLVGGLTVQFAEGSWPGQVGSGLAITEKGFDLVEPHLRLAAPDWTAEHRYGVFEISPSSRKDLASRLRNAAADLRAEHSEDARHELLDALAAWLEERIGRKSVGIFGI